MKLIIAIALLGIVALTASQESWAQSFNCAKAGTPDEIAICNDPWLGQLDEEMSSIFYSLMNELVRADPQGYRSQQADLKAEQREWLRRRGTCYADAACIGSSYSKRIEELRGYFRYL